VLAAANGHVAVVAALLDASHNAARADAQDSLALVRAAQNGHEAVLAVFRNALG
jgi:ankyrin repeat protein